VIRDAQTSQKQSEFKCARLKKQVAATHSKTKATKPAGRRRYKSQRRPPKGGRYKFKSNVKGWRSEDRRYNVNDDRERTQW